jgi:hypothetical protein
MSISTICKRCREPIIATDEDDLVAQVQAHARDHGGARGKHVPTREHILRRLHRNDADTLLPFDPADLKADSPR